MIKLVKISAYDCDICNALAEVDDAIAKENNMEIQVIPLEVLSQMDEGNNIRDYVVSYYVNADDGAIDVPIYLIVQDNDIKASSVVGEEAELHNLLYAWERYLQLSSNEPATT